MAVGVSWPGAILMPQSKFDGYKVVTLGILGKR